MKEYLSYSGIFGALPKASTLVSFKPLHCMRHRTYPVANPDGQKLRNSSGDLKAATLYAAPDPAAKVVINFLKSKIK